MKLLHCADLHLDSNMNSYLSEDKAKERKNELLRSFEEMVAYAINNDVYGIIIAGDLFDKKNISATARNVVMHEIINNPELKFYYIRGNHDESGFWGDLEVLPENLYVFGKNWTSYSVYEAGNRKITISGMEMDETNVAQISSGRILRAEDYNIVTLHGQEADSPKKGAYTINLKALRNRFIDYLALGHIHYHKEEALDARGVYCYSGCLMGRGFDECGKHGFVLIDIDEDSFCATREFIHCEGRNLYELYVDISDCNDSMDIVDRIHTEIHSSGYSKESLVKIILVGKVSIDCDINIEYIAKKIEDEFYYTRIKNETGIKIDYDMYIHDESLKGEFVRTVKANTTLSDEEKSQIIRYGIRALRGEEI